MDKAYETRRLFLKDKCKTFTLTKQLRDLDVNGLGEREVLNKIYNYLIAKYHLGNDKKNNQQILIGHGFVFGNIRTGIARTVRENGYGHGKYSLFHYPSTCEYS